MGSAQTALPHRLFPRNGSGLLNSLRERKKTLSFISHLKGWGCFFLFEFVHFYRNASVLRRKRKPQVAFVFGVFLTSVSCLPASVCFCLSSKQKNKVILSPW